MLSFGLYDIDMLKVVVALVLNFGSLSSKCGLILERKYVLKIPACIFLLLGMKPGISRGKNGSAGKEDVPALPRGITISKVGSPSKSQEPDGMKMSAGARKTQRQRFNLNHHYSENDRPEVSSFSGNAPLPVKLRIGGKPKIVALKKKLDELWPANRQMRADILHDFILGKAGCKQLLFARGVVFEFDQARGDYHLPEHKAQRVKHKKQ